MHAPTPRPHRPYPCIDRPSRSPRPARPSRHRDGPLPPGRLPLHHRPDSWPGSPPSRPPPGHPRRAAPPPGFPEPICGATCTALSPPRSCPGSIASPPSPPRPAPVGCSSPRTAAPLRTPPSERPCREAEFCGGSESTPAHAGEYSAVPSSAPARRPSAAWAPPTPSFAWTMTPRPETTETGRL